MQPPNRRPTRPSSSIHLTFTSQEIICLTTPVKNLTPHLSICHSQMKPLLKCYSNLQIRLLNRRGESPTNLRLTFNSSLKQCQRVSCRALTVLRHRIPLTTFSREKLTGLSRKPRKSSIGNRIELIKWEESEIRQCSWQWRELLSRSSTTRSLRRTRRDSMVSWRMSLRLDSKDLRVKLQGDRLPRRSLKITTIRRTSWGIRDSRLTLELLRRE